MVLPERKRKDMNQVITISATEIASFKDQLGKFSERKMRQFRAATETAVLNMVSDAKQGVPVYQGRLRSSIKPIMGVSKLSGRAWTDVGYAAAVEFGTKSLVKVPNEIAQYAAHFRNLGTGDFDELLEQITKWCRKKGIPPEAAYPIARKLATKGQGPQPYLYPAFVKQRKWYTEVIKKIMQQP